MLIDEYMPRWEVRSRHSIAVAASCERTYTALRTANLGSHFIVRALLALRTLPSALRAGRTGALRARASRAITLQQFETHGFSILEERPPHDLLIGLEGAFWRPRGDLRPVSAQSFKEPVAPGLARAAWSFSVAPNGTTGSVLTTETRVLTSGGAARWQFRTYWTFIGWASGIIRRLMLHSLKTAAEVTP